MLDFHHLFRSPSTLNQSAVSGPAFPGSSQINTLSLTQLSLVGPEHQPGESLRPSVSPTVRPRSLPSVWHLVPGARRAGDQQGLAGVGEAGREAGSVGGGWAGRVRGHVASFI